MKMRRNIIFVLFLTLIIIIVKTMSAKDGEIINLNEPAFFLIGGFIGLSIANKK